ncbi:MAG TPA: serine/threonine-protein kinase, partial [Candidatus Melainabacteria bacterium]|nr:serine/threonine-protein kinase [Candidatus Melainabacteria bacterium]
MSADEDNNEKDVSVRLCPVCNKRVFDQDGASVTQWIFRLYGCTCKSKQLAEPVCEEPREASAEFAICTNCGKRIRDVNEGSLTQWIFQSHTCSCGMPRPRTGGSSSAPEVNAEIPAKVSIVTRYEPAQSGEIQSDPVLSAWLKEMGRYAPVKVLGKGASGSVYLCIDSYLQKPVAVKILNWITDDNIILFQQEAKVASGLNHPYIVKVLDIGVTAGAVPFMVMDFVEGESLEDYLAHTSNNACVLEEEALDYALTLLDALSYLHQHGIFHRDLKSGNIILCRDSDTDERLHPVLVDLGLAARAPASDQLVGTVGYMAPEYIAGGAYSVYTEIYSFGCLLFEMLTGSLPYRGDSLLETLEMHRDSAIPSLNSRRDDIEFSPGLDALVQRCLAKEETERYQSLSELKEAVEAVRQHLPEEEKEMKEVTTVA